MRNTTDTQIEMSNGNYTTRINKVNRHSEEGFRIRMNLKKLRTRKPIVQPIFGGVTKSLPIFFNK